MLLLSIFMHFCECNFFVIFQESLLWLVIQFGFPHNVCNLNGYLYIKQREHIIAIEVIPISI